jgi:hypothetical protein
MSADTAADKIKRSLLLARTLPRLGLGNVASVAAHRLALRAGWYRHRTPVESPLTGPLFASSLPLPEPPILPSDDTVAQAERTLDGELCYFSHAWHRVGSPPDWFADPFGRARLADTDLHWSSIPDFSTGVSDIKVIWEPSRWEWALLFARAYRLTGDTRFWEALNRWSTDWLLHNPPNRGPNWKCGQEAAIRLINALLANHLLGQQPSEPLCDFVSHHCRRITSTRRYALAQRNNHATSEAAGLFVGGGVLARHGATRSQRQTAERWCDLGRGQLERCVSSLVLPDGSFSQHSLNYHRVLVDTLCQAELWRQWLGLQPFSLPFLERARAAVTWLHEMVDPHCGDGPNVGANDGARLFPLCDAPYRDYRPTVQTGYQLFHGHRAYEPGPWDAPLALLGLPRQEQRTPRSRKSQVFQDGGYVTLQAPVERPRSWALVRSPNYDTRPGHADALHVDLWVDGVNLLRDGGSYSYAHDDCDLRGSWAHNTVHCDDHDQMPRFGRFLYADWIEADAVGDIERTCGSHSWSGAYTDAYGCHHARTVSVDESAWRITDMVRCQHHAVLRWRLAPSEWSLDAASGRCTGPLATIEVSCSTADAQQRLTDGWESRHYLKRTPLPVLEITAAGDRIEFTTTIVLKGSR